MSAVISRARRLWRIVMTRRLRIGRLSIYIEPRDIWVGVYVAPSAVYVCTVPLIAMRWERTAALERARPAEARLQAFDDLIAGYDHLPGNAYIPIEVLRAAAGRRTTEERT